MYLDDASSGSKEGQRESTDKQLPWGASIPIVTYLEDILVVILFIIVSNMCYPWILLSLELSNA